MLIYEDFRESIEVFHRRSGCYVMGEVLVEIYVFDSKGFSLQKWTEQYLKFRGLE